MMKFKIEVDETRNFRHEFVVEAENADKLDSILDEIESERMLGINDYEGLLEENGLKIIESVTDEDGDLGGIECTDIEDFEEA